MVLSLADASLPVFDLTSRVAIVTGGNGGIGLGMARGLARAGARVVVAARNMEKAAAAVSELSALGSPAMAHEVDVSNEDSVDCLVNAVVHRYGRVDILVNNAGINIRGPVQDLQLDQWNAVLAINLSGAYLCAKAVYPVMKSRHSGKVINIGSMLSIFGASYAPAYGASKGGVVQLTKSLAVAWAQDNIQVNAVLPGWIETDLTKASREHTPSLDKHVLERTPSGRWGTVDDLEGLAVFLASSESDFITGVAIPVDGGYSAAV